MENDKEETFNDEDNELEEYKLSYYKWGSYCFKAAFIVMAALIFRIIVGLIKY